MLLKITTKNIKKLNLSKFTKMAEKGCDPPKISNDSIFTKIINNEIKADRVYQD